MTPWPTWNTCCSSDGGSAWIRTAPVRGPAACCLLLQFDLAELAAGPARPVGPVGPVRDYPAESLDRLTVAAALMDAPELPPAGAWTVHVRPEDPADGPLVTARPGSMTSSLRVVPMSTAAILAELLPLMADRLRAWDISLKELWHVQDRRGWVEGCFFCGGAGSWRLKT